MIWLDEAKDQYGFFHLIFLLRFASYLGFAPLDAEEIAQQLQEANYKILLDAPATIVLNQLIESDYTDGFLTDRHTRNALLESILAFYDLHIDSLGEVKSLAVLREVMK